ncbi:MAG: hypothetical protein A4E64_00020 [Syntrophorhabdus sp. PtaU1.Bin058]|nr:MAG: hypothetical protein A4E64_00020 [Syntrophorhabdus sp. PtaU1.Bin058]
MTHAPAGRGRETCDKGYNRFFHVVPEILCRLFLCPAAYLADDDHRIGPFILFEHRKEIDKGKAYDRIAADPHAGGLADPHLGKLVYDLIGKGPAP